MASVEMFTVLMTLLVVHCGEHLVNGVITDVRLVGGPIQTKGTIEIRIDNGTWEKTCGTNIDTVDAVVICRHLGFTGASRAIQDTPYGHNLNPTIVLSCRGDEANLTKCALFTNQMCSTAGAASCHGEGYLGCFEDVSNERVLPGESLVDDPDMTISYCIEFCNSSISASYVYAGVENGKECFCGEASDNYTRYGEGTDTNCQVLCAGDPNESCGGVGYIAVFRIPNLPSTSTAVPTLTSTYQSTVRRSSVQSQSPTTPGVRSTDSVDTGGSSPASSPPPVMTTSMRQSPPVLPQNGDNVGLYAGVAGGVVAIVIVVVIIIIIVVVLLMRKRSRRQQKDGFQSHDMTVRQPASPNGTQDNLYHDMFQDNSDETPHGLQLPDAPTDGDVTYYSSVRDHATSYSPVKDQNSKNTDSKLNNTMPSDQNDGSPEKRVSQPQPNGDVEAMYAMPDKPRKSQGEEDFGALYAKPDKTGKNGEGQGSEDFGALYAMPDKRRGVPEGREDVSQVGPESGGNSGEGLYSLADDDTGLYAMSTAPGHTVNNDDNEYGTVMVDNELYAM